MLTSTEERPQAVLSSACRVLSSFIVGLFNFYEDLFFTYLEINPLGRLIIFVLTLFATWMCPCKQPWRLDFIINVLDIV